jgi:hypothetical protein
MTWTIENNGYSLRENGQIVAVLSHPPSRGAHILALLNAAEEAAEAQKVGDETKGVTDVHGGLTPTARILELEALLEQAKREAEEACQHARVVIGQRDAQRKCRDEAEAEIESLRASLVEQMDRAILAERALTDVKRALQRGRSGENEAARKQVEGEARRVSSLLEKGPC